MRAFGYIRVSKSSEDGVSPDVQRARISPLHSQQGSLTRRHSTGTRSDEHDSAIVIISEREASACRPNPASGAIGGGSTSA